MRRTDIFLRWFKQVRIEQACRELSLVSGHFGITLDGYAFAVQETGTYIHGCSIEEVTRQEPNITTGGGIMRNAASAEWATFSVQNHCETPRAGFTFEIKLRRNCTLAPAFVQASQIPSAKELINVAKDAAHTSSADVVYGVDVGAYKGCFSHPDPKDAAVPIWLARGGLSKLPCLRDGGSKPSEDFDDYGNQYVFTDRAGKVLPFDALDSNDYELLTTRCRVA